MVYASHRALNTRDTAVSTWVNGCVCLDDVPERQPAGTRRLQLTTQPRNDALRQRVVQAEGVANGVHLHNTATYVQNIRITVSL